MAFFGLTALGPQNVFEVVGKSFRNIQIFEDHDFVLAWKNVNGDNCKVCSISKIEYIMKALFHGPIPKSDQETVVSTWSKYQNDNNTIDFDTFINIMREMRDQAEREYVAFHNPSSKLNDSCEFSSSQQLQYKINYLQPMKDLKEKQQAPLTAMQEYGWRQPEKLEPPVASRSQSEITKYQGELIKNGIFY